MFERNGEDVSTTALRFLLLMLGLLTMSGATAWSGQQDKPSTVTIKGRLERVMAIGGETTGWAIKLDKETSFGGRKVRSVEIDPKGRDITPLNGRRVEVKGVLAGRRGVERIYTVLEINSIKEAK